jgi:hypothetical protein
MSLFARLLLVLSVGFAAAPAARAQDVDNPGADIFTQGFVAPDVNADINPPAATLPTPSVVPAPAPGAAMHAPPGPKHNLRLEAHLVADGPAVTNGLIWRVFGSTPAENGDLPLVAETAPVGSTLVQLPAGDYFVHAAFGRAGATKRISIGNADATQSLVLDAGGMKLEAVVGPDERPVPPNQLTFEVQQQDEGGGDFITIVPNAAPGRVLRLPAGTYHVVSHYGNVNAVVRADIEVKAGKLTDAVMRHNGGSVTLKLVAEDGGEAIANTSWTVTTQDGNAINESIGAFPTLVLAAGDYTAVAKHEGQVYTRDFTVESGMERDIEVRLTDVVQPGPDVLPDNGEGVPADVDTDSD